MGTVDNNLARKHESGSGSRIKKIALEEHFTTEEHLECMQSIIEKRYPVDEVIREERIFPDEVPFVSSTRLPSAGEVIKRLLDIGDGRLQEMDRTGIDMQVLSLISPGVQMLDGPAANSMAKRINDELAGKISLYPERFVGLATLAPQDPASAAAELERAVKDLGLKGASINSHTKGEYLDDKKYWVIFEKAEKLDVPIYLHPRSPSPDMLKPYLGYPLLNSAILGFAAETGLHAVRLMCSGLFDTYSRLKIILGHLGEALPFFMKRMDKKSLLINTKRRPSEYLKDNFFISTSAMFWEPPLLCCIQALGADRILFAVDYPLESNDAATEFIETASIPDTDKRQICYLNAEKLLAL